MAVPVIMPRQGQSVESCIIGEWHVAKGDKVQEGDKLFTYETDKATFDEVAPVSGEIIAVFFEEGDDIPCLRNVLVIGDQGEDWQQFIPEGATADGKGAAEENSEPETVAAESEAAPQKTESAAPVAAAGTSAVADGLDHPVSPRARSLAEKHYVDLKRAAATGPNGRIIERDVEAAIAQGLVTTAAASGEEVAAGVEGSGIGGAIRVEDLSRMPELQNREGAAYIDNLVASLGEAEYEDTKLPNIRKVIARTMRASLTNMAQLTFNTPVDIGKLLKLRKHMKTLKENGMGEALGLTFLEQTPTINDFFLYVVSRVAKKFPDFNAHFHEEEGYIRHYKHVHLGIAVATDRGLMVPVIKNADLKSLSQISAEAKELAAACHEGSISPDKLQGGTITVTNMGTNGVETFTPVINPPETCIVGINSSHERVRRDAEGNPEFYPCINISLTVDHRAIDGSPAGNFNKALKQAVENIDLMLMA